MQCIVNDQYFTFSVNPVIQSVGGYQSELIGLRHCIFVIHIGAWILVEAKFNRQEIKFLTYLIFQVSVHREMYETILILHMHCEDGTLSKITAFVSCLHVP